MTKLSDSMVTITITGLAGCGKTWTADKIAEALEFHGEKVQIVDEYHPNREASEHRKGIAVASNPNVLILVTETTK